MVVPSSTVLGATVGREKVKLGLLQLTDKGLGVAVGVGVAAGQVASQVEKALVDKVLPRASIERTSALTLTPS